jgi:Vacuolar protein sorting-associated protein 62
VRRRLALFVLVALALVPSAGGADSARPPYAVLLARHVPILVLHPAEQFAPVPVDGFLADSDLQQRTAAGWETIPGPLPAGGADLRLDQRTCFAIEGPAASGCYAGAEAAHVSGPVVYGKVLRSRTRIDLQYWIWYPFNDHSASFPPGEVWQVHEGDWESVSVILDLEGRPLVVGLSKHCEGTRRDWSDARRRGARPIAYVALGSHANYFEPGTFRHSPVCWPRALRDVVRALRLRDRTGSGRVVRPLLVPVTSTQPSWMQFAGKWGESGYLHFPNNPPIAYEGAPRAPAFQETWRRPVSEELSWPPG